MDAFPIPLVRNSEALVLRARVCQDARCTSFVDSSIARTSKCSANKHCLWQQRLLCAAAVLQAGSLARQWKLGIHPRRKRLAVAAANGRTGINSKTLAGPQPDSVVQAPKAVLKDLSSWFFSWLRPAGKSGAQLPEQDMERVRNFVLGLQRYAEVSDARANKAEQEVAALEKERQSIASELKRARRELQLMARYAEDVENERDAVEAELQAMRQSREAQRQELLQLSQHISDLADVTSEVGTALDALPSKASSITTPLTDCDTVGHSEDGMRAPGEMSLEELKAECMVRGLSSEGSLAAVRGRIRAARASDRDT
mmetsp:Transcript_96841/g.172328  ORF Transcript_96841/g.172328 Transcript_96841/m.172328 type:complete len:314 (+) Transcript_96841:60-1001(+)|eukprot:CAMPEP_0197652672 /NCGR_PEP_ID=MMETSP1338-20131121/34593_1 /TAXON_ID=43686 ORGANISM="Pelagodinium beii, Strain RCC1491" /NCGR_SAMPLE_ID=MMETSP1338 /ASSEMBLY_ACC=CAM_ASM_000754 /LENGTH=313 /DNA_ID=CAMNT_0043227599 /DNA_START=54 /DNA_END=995 /DNA_ORIENTATION=+